MPGVQTSMKSRPSIVRRIDWTTVCESRRLRCICVAAHVQPAVAEADRLVDVLLVELERERRRAREDLERVDLELDLAGRQVRVDRLGRAGDDLAVGLDDELVAQRVGGRVRLGARSGWITSWQSPVWSRRSTKTSPPWSRRVSTQPGERQLLPDVLGADVAAAEVAPAHATPRRSVPASTTTTSFAPRRARLVCWPLTERPAKSVSAFTPAARSSATFASTAARSAPSAQT